MDEKNKQTKKRWIETCEKIIIKKKITCFKQKIKIEELSMEKIYLENTTNLFRINKRENSSKILPSEKEKYIWFCSSNAYSIFNLLEMGQGPLKTHFLEQFFARLKTGKNAFS